MILEEICKVDLISKEEINGEMLALNNNNNNNSQVSNLVEMIQENKDSQADKCNRIKIWEAIKEWIIMPLITITKGIKVVNSNNNKIKIDIKEDNVREEILNLVMMMNLMLVPKKDKIIVIKVVIRMVTISNKILKISHNK